MSLTASPAPGSIAISNSKSSVIATIEQVLQIGREELAQSDGQRKTRRFPYTEYVEVNYVDPNEENMTGLPINVKCRNLSLGGLGFFHTEPLPLRNVLIQLDPASELPPIAMKLLWCRCLTTDWYEIGGIFIDAEAEQDTEQHRRVVG